MDRIALFIDVSLNPRLKCGVGAYLIVPASFLEVPPPGTENSKLAELLVTRRFEGTSSTTLEVQTVLWALAKYHNEATGPGLTKLQVYSDSQCIAGLLNRRSGLEARDFLSKKTGRLLTNASLYRTYYALHDQLGFELIKVKGHTPKVSHDTVQRVFSFVDRSVRKALHLWIAEVEAGIAAGNFAEKADCGDWCVYALRCSNNSLYIGLTNNLGKRLKEHEQGRGSKFVRSWRPFELVKTIPCKNAEEARRLEYYLKQLKRDRKIEVLGLREEEEGLLESQP